MGRIKLFIDHNEIYIFSKKYDFNENKTIQHEEMYDIQMERNLLDS